VSDYGVLPGPITQEQYLGLLLNSNRAVLRKAYFAALASSLIHTKEEVPLEIVRAASDNNVQAEQLALKINTARMQANKGWK
jgi:hypothetical protein